MKKENMKKLISLMAMVILVVSVLPVVFANDAGTGVNIDIPTEDFGARVWMCDNRAVIDDEIEPGRLESSFCMDPKYSCDEEDSFPITTELLTRGTGEAELSTDNAVSGNSARLYAPFITGPTNEGTIRITFPNGLTLDELDSISWTAFVAQGYAPHVDVKIDVYGDGLVDDALVFEYAKVDPLDCDDSVDYPTGSVDTFGDKGIVDTNAYAWLSTGVPGPCGNGAFDTNHKNLSDWKTTYPNAIVTAIEIEVDGWVVESEAFIDNVMINDILVERFSDPLGGGGCYSDNFCDVNPESEFCCNNNPNLLGCFVSDCFDDPAITTWPVYSEKIETCECKFEGCITGCLQGQTSFEFECDGLPCEVDFDFVDNNPLYCETACFEYTKKWSCDILKGDYLVERTQNYAFEGEKIEWLVLVMDKNKIEEVQDVVVTVGPTQSTGDSGGSQTVTRTDTVEDCDSTTLRLTNWNDVLTLDKFDPSLGTLIEAEFNVNSNFSSDVQIEHLSDESTGEYIIDVNGQVIVIDTVVSLIADVSFQQTANLALFDGTIDYSGDSGVTFPTETDSDSDMETVTDSLELSNFIGVGDTFDLTVDATGENTVSGPSTVASIILTRASAQACVTYTYEYEDEIPISGNDPEVECVRLNGFAAPGSQILPSCNARILEEEIEQFDDQTMAYYECTLTVETPESMWGENWITVEAISNEGVTVADENEYWFFNPTIALTIDGDLMFTGSDGVTGVRPGTVAYSDTILVGNDAEFGSGVLLDMFISGTDFYDGGLGGSGARCVITNRLKLGNNLAAPILSSNDNVCDIGFGDTDDHLCYYATNGAYSTETDPRSDAEGYVPIVYGDTFTKDFYNDAEIMQPLGVYNPGYQPGNILAPGAEVALTFKLGLPEPCVGDFTDGSIYFWGEAI